MEPCWCFAEDLWESERKDLHLFFRLLRDKLLMWMAPVGPQSAVLSERMEIFEIPSAQVLL